MSAIKKVLVIGATGMIGKPVTRELIDAGFEVSLLSRNAAEAQRLFGISKVFNGDVKDEQLLMNAMRGQDAVYLSLSIKRGEKKKEFHTESDGMKLILSAAKKQGVKRIAYLSSLVMNYNGMNGFNWWVFELKQEAVKLIKASGVPWTIFYPSNFMESLDHLYLAGSKLMLAGESKHKMYFIAGKDYGKTVAKALMLDSAANKDYAVQGPEAYTADEAVKIFQQAYTKRRLKIMKAPLGMLKLFAPFSAKMNYGIHILEALNNYPEKFESETTWSELYKPQITVEEYVKAL